MANASLVANLEFIFSEVKKLKVKVKVNVVYKIEVQCKKHFAHFNKFSNPILKKNNLAIYELTFFFLDYCPQPGLIMMKKL